jgi:hypothetical protein
MHPFSILTVGIFVAGYITARWDLVTRLYELAIFAWDHNVFVRLICPPLAYQHQLTCPLDTRGQGLRNPLRILFPIHNTHRTNRCARNKSGMLLLAC